MYKIVLFLLAEVGGAHFIPFSVYLVLKKVHVPKLNLITVYYAFSVLFPPFSPKFGHLPIPSQLSLII